MTRVTKNGIGKKFWLKKGKEIKVRKAYKRKYEVNNPLEFQRAFTTARFLILIEFPLSISV
jgi:hypothetical protein